MRRQSKNWKYFIIILSIADYIFILIQILGTMLPNTLAVVQKLNPSLFEEENTIILEWLLFCFALGSSTLAVIGVLFSVIKRRESNWFKFPAIPLILAGIIVIGIIVGQVYIANPNSDLSSVMYPYYSGLYALIVYLIINIFALGHELLWYMF